MSAEDRRLARKAHRGNAGGFAQLGKNLPLELDGGGIVVSAATLAPMPRASVRSAMVVIAGVRPSFRRAKPIWRLRSSLIFTPSPSLRPAMGRVL